MSAQKIETSEFAGEVGLGSEEGLETGSYGCVAGVEGGEGGVDGG